MINCLFMKLGSKVQVFRYCEANVQWKKFLEKNITDKITKSASYEKSYFKRVTIT